MANERKFWGILAESQHDKLVLSWLSVVLTVLVIVLSAFLSEWQFGQSPWWLFRVLLLREFTMRARCRKPS